MRKRLYCSPTRQAVVAILSAGVTSVGAARAAPPEGPTAPPGSAASAAPGAPAQIAPANTTTTTAEVLRQRADDAIARGDLRAAADALRAAYRLDASSDTACNLGLVAQRLGRHVEAAAALHRCMRIYALVPPMSEGERARYDALRAEIKQAKTSIAVVVVEAISPGAQLSVDGAIVPADAPLFLEPGRHVIRAQLGEASMERVIDARPGEEHRVDLTFGARAGKAAGETERKTVALHAEPSAVRPLSPPKTPWEAAASPAEGQPGRDPRWVIGGAVTAILAGAFGGVLFAVARARDEAAWSSAQSAGVQSPTACAVEHVEPACSHYERAAASSNTLRDVGIASLIGGALLGTATFTYALSATITIKTSATATGAQVLIRW